MEMERRFGEHIHVIDWALHLDEATPHIHERHVFDYVNHYGEVEPKQEKALEALGFELPDPDKKPGRTNNRKMVFDAVCRVILFDICKRHGLAVEEEPDPGNRGRSYLEKNDYIIQKQKKLIVEQETAIEEKAQTLEAALFPNRERANRQGAGKGTGIDSQSRSKSACQDTGCLTKAGGQSRCHQTNQGEGQRVRPCQTETGQSRDCQTGCGAQGGAVPNKAQCGAIIVMIPAGGILAAATGILSVMFFETGLSCH